MENRINMKVLLQKVILTGIIGVFVGFALIAAVYFLPISRMHENVKSSSAE